MEIIEFSFGKKNNKKRLYYKKILKSAISSFLLLIILINLGLFFNSIFYCPAFVTGMYSLGHFSLWLKYKKPQTGFLRFLYLILNR